MKFIKIISVLGLILFMGGALCSPTLALNPGLPNDAVIIGPEYWGTVVVDTVKKVAYLRVKRVVNCEVETQLLAVEEWQTIPSQEGLSVGTEIPVPIFDNDPVGTTPIITKEKNWKDGKSISYDDDGNPVVTPDVVFSFDVQIKFKTN